MKKNKNYILTTLNKAVKDDNLKNLDLRVLLCLVSYNGKGEIKPGLKTIAKDIGIRNNSISSVSNSITRLKKSGYITIKRRFQKPNIYSICDFTGIKEPKPEEKEKTKQPERPEKEITKEEVSEYLNKYSLSEETKNKAIENITSGKITIPEYDNLMSVKYENSLWRDLTVKYLAGLRGAERPENPDFSVIGGFIKHNRKDLTENAKKYIILIQCIGKYEKEIRAEGITDEIRGFIGKAFKEYYNSYYIKLYENFNKPETSYKPKPKGEKYSYL